MAPLTKDSVDVAGSVSEVSTRPVSPQKSTPAAGQLRADARSVEIPVKVHGSRVSDAPHGAAPRTEPFEEQTSTMIVFPQGGVIRMSTSVNVGQMLVVTNLKTRQDAICRVIKVRTFTNMQGYVEVEFTHKQDGYWGVQFTGNAPAVAATPAPAAISTPVTPAPPVPGVPAPQPAAAAPVAPVRTVQEIPVVPTVVAPAPQPQVAAPISVPSVAPRPEVVAPPKPAPSVQQPLASAPSSQVTPLPPPTFVPPPPVTASVAPPVPTKSSVTPSPVAPPKQESPFVWIGTQEEVQPAASATETIKPGSVSLSSRLSAPTRPVAAVESQLPELPKIELPTVDSFNIPARAEEISELPASSLAATELTMSELRGDAASLHSSAAAGSIAVPELEQPATEEKPAESSRAVFGSLSGGASFGANRSASADAFGARLDSALGSSEEIKGESRSNNWMLIAISVGLLFAVVIGGAMYFRSQSNVGTANQSTPQSQQVAAEQNALQNSAIQSSPNGPVATIAPSGAPAVTVSASSSPSSTGNATAKPASPAKQAVDKIAAIFHGSTIEHPVTPQRTDAATPDAAPALDPGSAADSSSGNALPGVISSSTMAAPAAPEIRPEGPIVKGGEVAEPKLIYRALPVYPLSAKQAGIQGEVVIKTTIDQKGSVVDMHVVSGPLMLRQAALDALRRWKYEPSKLDGQPISVQMLITIKFSR
jgi:TonB family protein